MTENAKLAFGVELELLLKPKKKFAAELENIYSNWAAKFERAKEMESEVSAEEATGADTDTGKADADALRAQFREELATLLTNVASIPTATTGRSSGFQYWSVVDEPTLEEVPGYCKSPSQLSTRLCIGSHDCSIGRVELVSRAIASDEEWQEELDKVFKVLSDSTHMILTTGCCMHVHVSPSAKPKGKQDRWTSDHLNKIMKAISYFTDPVVKIMPAERKENPYAMPNMLSEDIAKEMPQLSTAYKQVQTETWKPLFNIYDSQMKTALQKTQAFGIMGHCRYVAWNFEHITDACGTVEFRQCPGITTSVTAKHWASFALGFIYAAAFQTNLDYWIQKGAKTTHPSVEDLDSFTRAGAEGLESTSQGALRSLEEDTSEKKVWTSLEMKEILEKKVLLARLGCPESYPEKVSFCNNALRFLK